MPDSLTLAGRWELINQDDGQDDGPATLGPPPDADPTLDVPAQPYQIVQGYDLGSPVPVTATIVGDLLDGDRVAGTRTGNKTITLPIQITAPDRLSLSRLTDQLMGAVNVSTFTLTWWPDGGAPIIWDCYRATTEITWDVRWEGQFQRVVTVTASAYPFGRSSDLESVSVAADPFLLDTTVGMARTTADTTRFHDAPSSAKIIANWVISKFGNYYAPGGGPAFRDWSSAPRDLTPYKALTLWVYVDSNDPSENMEFELTVKSQTPNSSDTYQIINRSQPTCSWRLLSFPVGTRAASSHTGKHAVDYQNITEWNLTFRDYRQFWATPCGASFHGNTLRVNIDSLMGVPSSSIAVQTTNGALLTVPGIIGTARAPAALHLTSPIDSSGMLVHRPPIDADPDAVILMPLNTGQAGQGVTVPASGSGYAGTYTVVLAMESASAATHEAVFTATQRITSANTVIDTQTLDYIFTPPTGQPFPYAVVGQITLPLRGLPADGSSTSTSYRFTITLSTGDAATDMMLLDTRGQTMIASLPRVVRGLWIDEPDPDKGIGLVLVAAAEDNRAGCYGVMDTVRISGGPFSLDPGDNQILVHSTGGSPALTATYAPRWLAERSAGVIVLS